VADGASALVTFSKSTTAGRDRSVFGHYRAWSGEGGNGHPVVIRALFHVDGLDRGRALASRSGLVASLIPAQLIRQRAEIHVSAAIRIRQLPLFRFRVSISFVLPVHSSRGAINSGGLQPDYSITLSNGSFLS